MQSLAVASEIRQANDDEGYPLPERALAAAVMRRALLDISGNIGGDPKLRRKIHKDAYRWLFTTRSCPKTTMSFAWVCTTLDFCPSRMRAEATLLLKGKGCIELLLYRLPRD
jgi:hypothetical protein